ncbi:hypothetical protein P791_1258 [Enterococcus faecalis NY9]|nr:hypothetical protein P791_1258 [Enterococcus faecalis NY9]
MITNQVIDNEAIFIDSAKIEANYLPRNQKYEIYNRLFQERKSFSKTDTKTLNLFLDSFLEQYN